MPPCKPMCAVLYCVMLATTAPALAEEFDAIKKDVQAALEDDRASAEEFGKLKPRLLAFLDADPGPGPKADALRALFALARAAQGNDAVATENDVVRRIAAAKFDAKELSDDAWSSVFGALRALGEPSPDLDRDASLRSLAHLDAVDKAATTTRMKTLVLAAKLRAALMVDRVAGGLPKDERDAVLGAVQRAPKDYLAVPVEGQTTFEAFVRPAKFELENLYPGRSAPDIVGIDLEEKPFKLSEFRGKTVVLIAWATWCPDCMNAIPGEKAVFDKFKDKSVVFLGINGDEDRTPALAAQRQRPIPWRSFWGRWSGADGKKSLIVDDWNVRTWPSYYVIDPQGVIRFKHCWDLDMTQLELAIHAAMAGSGP